MIGGASFGGGVKSGLISGGYSALAAGLLGGISGGIKSYSAGANFWTGIVTHNEVGSVEGALAAGAAIGDEDLLRISNEEFGFKMGDYNVVRLTIKRIPAGSKLIGDQLYSQTSKDVWEPVRGTTRVSLNSNKSRIYISPNTASNLNLLKSTLGHEFIHAYHNSLELRQLFGTNFSLLTENSAHTWRRTT